MPAKVESKPVSWLKPDPDQPRKTFDEEHLRRLGASLLKKQWYALLVRPTGMILDGECRFRAAKLVGMEKLDVILLDESISQAEATELQLVTALHRAALSPFEQACGFRDWLANNAGKTAKELAGRIDRDQSLITKYVSVFGCTPPVQEAAAAGKLGPSQWYPISLLTDGNQVELLEMHLAGMPRDQIASVSRSRRASGTTETVKTGSLTIVLGNGVKITVKGVDLTLASAADLLDKASKEAEKAKSQGLNAKTAERVWRDRARAKTAG